MAVHLSDRKTAADEVCVRRPACGWGQAAERGRLLMHGQCAVRGCWGPPPMRAASDW